MVPNLMPNQSKGLDAYGQDHLPLFNANNARRRAEQDSILLANRIRLLRAEEEKARKKVRETEGKTREIIDVRRRGEEKRNARDVDLARKEAYELELKTKQAGVREDQQQKILLAQRDIMQQKVQASAVLKHEREAHKQQIEYEQKEAAAEVAARAQRVRKEQQISERRRARSEGARLELGRANFQEKLAREDDARRANQGLMLKMEKEEADLIQRLQRSQQRHRDAFAQLEDALAGGSPTVGTGPAAASSSRCSTPPCTDQVPVHELPPQGATSSSTGSRTSLTLAPSSSSSVGTEVKANGLRERPPRPRVSLNCTPLPEISAGSASGGGAVRSRPTSAPRSGRSASVPRAPVLAASKPLLHGRCSRSQTALRDNPSTASICSTASGGPGPESAASACASGHSTPTFAAMQNITYTTADGLVLEIPPEEDLDLGKLLNA